jgi:hypothetical protein
MAVTESKEPTKAHHGIQDATGDLVDQQVVDFADAFIANSVDIGPLNILTQYCRLSGCAVAFATMAYPPSCCWPDNRRRMEAFQNWRA